ncbi:MAG TPA: GDSL-type esterase/lipase family protein [Planctomycetota bacterium]|nr:GDSL-type esterase/lipase family protein [Planctomycetota bacterium]
MSGEREIAVRRPIRGRWVLAAVSLLVALSALEVWARAHLGPAFVQGAFTGAPQALTGRFDPDLGWANRPGAQVRLSSGGAEYTVAINSKGLRDREHDYDPAPATVRIVLLGDSTSWGWGVEQDHAFADLLEQRLGPGVEVINLAVPGYGTDQELWLLEWEGHRYQPDLVLLGFVLNDVVGNANPSIHGMAKPHYVRGEDGEWLLEGRPVPEPSPIRQAFRRALRRAGMHVALAKLLEPPPPDYARPDSDSPAVQERIRAVCDQLVEEDSATHMLLGRLREACAQLEAPLLAFLIPHLHDRYLYDPAAPRPSDADRPDFATYCSRKLAEAGAKLGFQTLSLDSALLAATSKGENLDCGDEHLNARGNAIVAEVLERELRPRIEALLASKP